MSIKLLQKELRCPCFPLVFNPWRPFLSSPLFQGCSLLWGPTREGLKLLRACVWLPAAFRALHASGLRTSLCWLYVYLSLLLLVNLWHLPPFMWYNLAIGFFFFFWPLTAFVQLSRVEETACCCPLHFTWKEDTSFLSTRITSSLLLPYGAYPVFPSSSLPLDNAAKAEPCFLQDPRHVSIPFFPYLFLCSSSPRKLCLVSGCWEFWAEYHAPCHNVNLSFILEAIFFSWDLGFWISKVKMWCFCFIFLKFSHFHKWTTKRKPQSLPKWKKNKTHCLIYQNIIPLQLYYGYIKM